MNVLTDGAFGHTCQEAVSAMKGRCKASVEWSRMGKQDKAEKMLLACRDVFAEIVNVLIYEGSQILDEENLLPGPTESICAFKNEELQRLRDCSMYEMYGGRVKALYNMENQSRQDKWMPLRCAGYDGAAYRAQYNERKAKREIYPVISIVLNWGKRPWKAATTIRELIGFSLPEKAQEYLDRNRIHVFDMRFLPKEVRERFRGDARVVLEYLTNPEGSLWKEQELRNPGEVTRMLFALSGDRRYLEYVPFMETGGGKKMCEALDKAERTGIEKGIQQGREEGIRQGFGEGIHQGIQQGIQVLVSTCHELGLSFEDTASKVKEKFSLGDAEVQRDMKLYW